MGATNVGPARRRVAVAIAAVAVAVAACAPPPPDPATGHLAVAADFNQGLLWALHDPAGPPQGANDWQCRPSTVHPDPVILVHGTFANMADSWQALSPMLVNEGYCVFALNYGGDGPTAFFGGLRPMEQSAIDEFGPFVDRVLAATGAAQVDVIGHSQGTVVPRYWMRFGDSTRPDGTPKVHRYVGVAPAGGGTTFHGLLPMVDQLNLRAALASGCGACVEFTPGSMIPTQLADPNPLPGERFTGETQPGVAYTMLATRFDNFVTPYRLGFLTDPMATNTTVQDICPIDFADHLAMIYDPVTLRLALNALDPAHAVPPRCVWVIPVFGIDLAAS